MGFGQLIKRFEKWIRLDVKVIWIKLYKLNQFIYKDIFRKGYNTNNWNEEWKID